MIWGEEGLSDCSREILDNAGEISLSAGAIRRHPSPGSRAHLMEDRNQIIRLWLQVTRESCPRHSPDWGNIWRLHATPSPWFGDTMCVTDGPEECDNKKWRGEGLCLYCQSCKRQPRYTSVFVSSSECNLVPCSYFDDDSSPILSRADIRADDTL